MTEQATVTIRGVQWGVQVAVTSAELSQGLSGIASIPPYTGMLFDLGYERIVTVNTYDMAFPIDVVFISEGLMVTEGRLPLLPGRNFTTTAPCRYFLEVNAGEADSAGVEVGDDVLISGYTPTTTGSIFEFMVTIMIVAMMMKMIAGVVKEAR